MRASELRAERRVGSKKKAKEAAKVGAKRGEKGDMSKKQNAVKEKAVTRKKKGFGQVGLTMQLEMQSKRAGWGVSISVFSLAVNLLLFAIMWAWRADANGDARLTREDN